MAMMRTGKERVISFRDSFHGKTTGSQAVGGKVSGKNWMPIGMSNHVLNLAFPNKSELRTKSDSEIESFFNSHFEGLEKDISCVITEPYQGFSADFMETRYAKHLRRWCTDNKILLIVDEIQSGFGRTGKLFAYEHWDIRPDIVVCGKAISSSLPVSCVLMDFDTPDKSFNSTHGSNPVGLAASKASLEYLLDNNLIEESRNKGDIMKAFIEEWKRDYPKNIKKINCTGLLCGFYIEKEGNSKEENIQLVNDIIEEALRRGVLSVYTNSGTIKIGCPLTIPVDALLEGLQVLKESFEACIDIQG
jgi:4-aminobutyrate aminotransferase/(S)-3-amino-2-methylpropionate transaminase